MASCVFGAIMGILSIVGLLLASGAHDSMMYVAGLLLFLFGVAMIFGLIHRATSYPPK